MRAAATRSHFHCLLLLLLLLLLLVKFGTRRQQPLSADASGGGRTGEELVVLMLMLMLLVCARDARLFHGRIAGAGVYTHTHLHSLTHTHTYTHTRHTTHTRSRATRSAPPLYFLLQSFSKLQHAPRSAAHAHSTTLLADVFLGKGAERRL